MKIQKKKDMSARVDVEMTKATKPSPSIQSLINKGLNARLKKLNLVPGKKVNNRSYSQFTSLADDSSNFLELVWPGEKEPEAKVQYNFFKGTSKGQKYVKGTSQEKEGYKGGQEEGRQGKAKSQKERLKRERKGVITEQSVSIPHPSTFPDEILNYSWDHAVTYVLLHMPIYFLEAGLYCSQVHWRRVAKME